MTLSTHNIEEFREKINELMLEIYKIENYFDGLPNQDLLKYFYGYTPTDAVDIEIKKWTKCYTKIE